MGPNAALLHTLDVGGLGSGSDSATKDAAPDMRSSPGQVGCFCQLERRAGRLYGVVCAAPSTLPYMTPRASKPSSESSTTTKLRAQVSTSHDESSGVSSPRAEPAMFQRRPCSPTR